MDEESSSQRGMQIAKIVVVNIICWMVSLTTIGLGTIYLGNCPVEPNIPIYLIVMGSINIIGLTVSYIIMAIGKGLTKFLTGCGGAYLSIFSFGWLITGSRWIYVVYPPSYTPGTNAYCHQSLYQFAFILVSLQWAALSLVLIYGIFYFSCVCCVTRNTGHRVMSRSSFYGAF